jgi:ribonuclease Z
MALGVVLLGSGGGPDVATRTSRCGASVLVKAGPDLLLFDCGRRATEQIADAGYSPLAVDRLFFTHLHSGHTVGYPDFVLSQWVGSFMPGQPARTRFDVYGPAGTRHMTDRLFAKDGAFRVDLRGMADADLARKEFRIHGHRLSLEWPAVQVTEIRDLMGPGAIVSTVNWRVRATFVSHGSATLPCLGYRVDSGGGSVVIAGDTCPSEGLISLARGADLLIHEGAWRDDQLRQTGMTGSHTSATGVARVAASAGVQRLVVTSIPAVNDQPETLDALARVIGDGFSGEVTMARDLLALEV